MSAPGTQRYQDLDLRIDPILIGHAIAYAKSYEGEWEVMVAARELVRATGSLPLAVARMVLNCARADPRYATLLPAPQSSTFVGAFPALPEPGEIPEVPTPPKGPPVAPRASERPRRGFRVVRSEPERQPFNLKVSWPKRYGHTRSPTDRNVWHVLDPERSRITYFPEADEEHRYHTTIAWVCGKGPRIWSAVLCEAPPADLHMCRSCERLLEDDELADTERFGPLQQWWNEHGRRTP